MLLRLIQLCTALLLMSIYRFQAQVESEAFQIYNGKSTIENYSASTALSIARSMGLFSSMQREDAQELCADIIDLVLATDMTDHFSIVLSFKTEMKTALENECKTAGDKEWGPSDDCKIIQNICNLKRETRMAILKMAIKIADLGHCYLPWSEHVDWVGRLQEEFFLQGDAQRREKSADFFPHGSIQRRRL